MTSGQYTASLKAFHDNSWLFWGLSDVWISGGQSCPMWEILPENSVMEDRPLGTTFPHGLACLREDGAGEGPFPLGLQILERSPRKVKNYSPASSHCWHALVPWGHGMVIGQEMEAEKCCCNEPNHKGQPVGWQDPLEHQKAFYNCKRCTFEN